MKRWMAAISDLLVKLANPYRPERHYMRGGGTGGLSPRRPGEARTLRSTSREQSG